MTYLRNWDKLSVYFSRFDGWNVQSYQKKPFGTWQFGIIGVNLIIQKWKSKHLVCLSFWDMSCDPEFTILISVQKMWPLASLFHFGLHSGTIFCGKNDVICYFGERQVTPFFDKERPKNFMMPNWFFDHLQLFLF